MEGKRFVRDDTTHVWTRRTAVKTLGGSLAWIRFPRSADALTQASAGAGRPKPSERRFQSAAVEALIGETWSRIGDPALANLFTNCYPNTLDTTISLGRFEGKPDTTVITGDIAAMWLRDSSAQVWPYLSLAAQDPALQELLEGVIRRQVRCLLIDP
jgi:hypothetical protein